MASRASTVAFIAEQVAAAGGSVRKMFGEYAIHCDGKLTTLICDDQLFVKPTEAGRAHIGEVHEAPPYKGSKPCFLVPGGQWDDRDWLATLIRASAAELPLPGRSRRKGVPASMEAVRRDQGLAGPHRQAASARFVVPGDVPALKALIDATGLFPPDMLDDMLAPYFEQAPAGAQFWLTNGEGDGGGRVLRA